MGALSPWHLLIVALVILVLFGSTKLPGFARSIGRSMRIFKSEVKGLQREDEEDTDEESEKDKRASSESAPQELPESSAVPDKKTTTEQASERR